MQTLHVAVISADPITAGLLAGRLKDHFESVTRYHFMQDGRYALIKAKANAAIVDLETISLSELEQLCRAAPIESPIVCTSSTPAEAGMAAVCAGARDCYYPDDIQGIVGALHTADLAAPTLES